MSLSATRWTDLQVQSLLTWWLPWTALWTGGAVVYSDGASEIHRQPQPTLEQTGLKRAQRKLARRKKVSKRRQIKLRIGKLHRKIRNIGNTWGHRLTRAIASQARLLVLEKLYPQGMTASATGAVENSGSNVKAESGLNRSVPSTG